jgi:hypothetical protein
MRDQIIELALNEPELSPRELAVTFIDTKGYFVSESSRVSLLSDDDADRCSREKAGCFSG